MVTAVNEFFTTCKLPKNFSSTLFVLIPKNEYPSSAKDYRSITCCSTLYKCISKLICSRLNEALPIIVNENQGAFVKRRYMTHNILILHDFLRLYRGNNVPARCLLKIDLSKAYDTALAIC